VGIDPCEGQCKPQREAALRQVFQRRKAASTTRGIVNLRKAESTVAIDHREQLERAVDVEIGEASVKAIHLEDSIRIKRATGGAKYLGQLPLLREVQEERRRSGLD